MDQLEKARIAHASVPENLRETPRLLSATNSHLDPILHTIPYNQPLLQEALEANKFMTELMTDRMVDLPRPGTDDPIPHGSIQSLLVRMSGVNLKAEAKEWYRLRHHDLMRSVVDKGFVPCHWDERQSTPGISTPQSLQSAYEEASRLGFNIPEKFLSQNDYSSYGESEAFYAAREIGSGRFTFPLKDQDYSALRHVVQVSSSFLVPHWNPGFSPLVADQLWIVGGPGQTIRFLVLEIDGEHHLELGRQENDRKRDKHFQSLGYEVYRVAGWWARIDPFRVIGDFLDVALGIRSFQSAFMFAPDSIDDYRCFACREPMVRWDDNWIVADEESHYTDDYPEDEDGRRVFVHSQCSKDC